MLLQKKIVISSYSELSKRYSDFISSFSELFREFVPGPQGGVESSIQVIPKLISQASDMLNISFYNRDDAFQVIQNNLLNQIKYLIVLREEISVDAGESIYVEKIVDMVKQEKNKIFNSISSFLNNLSVKIKDEQENLDISVVKNLIRNNALELKKIKSETNTLMLKINKTKKDLESINSLEKKTVELHLKRDDLKEKLKNIEGGKEISISRLETIQRKLPVESKVLFDDIDSTILDVKDRVSRKKEMLDDELLRNFVEELEELQTEDHELLLRDEKIQNIRKHLSLFGIKIDDGASLPDIIKEVKQKETSILESVTAVSIADIVNNLNQASKNIDDLSLIDSSNKSVKDVRSRKFRFLTGLKKSASFFERVQDSLGEAYITKSRFNALVKEKLDNVNLNLQELEQSFRYGKNMDNLLSRTYEDLKEIQFIYSKETRIMFLGNNILSDDVLNKKSDLKLTSIFQKPLSGFEKLTKAYLIAITEE